MNADAVYDVLVVHAGARDTESNRMRFRYFWGHKTAWNIDEYRFMGALGFGGKLWRNTRTDECDVTCYGEDETTERRAIIEVTNAALKALASSDRGEA